MQPNHRTPDEIRVVVACDPGAMHVERVLLERIVFPELRMACSRQGFVLTDNDPLRRSPDLPQRELLRGCLDEIGLHDAYVIVLTVDGNDVIARGIAEAIDAQRDTDVGARVWWYARRAVPRAVRENGFRFRQGWRAPEALAAWVRDDLLDLLAARQHPERRALDRERHAHEAYAASCRIGTIVRPELIALLDRHIEGAEPPLVLHGPSGSGKSTLVAQWCAGYRMHHPDAFVIVHHIGAAVSGETGADVARRVIEEIRDRIAGVSLPQEISAGPTHELPMYLARLWPERLTLVIDGANQLVGESSLEWLPAFIPSNVRMVVTTTDPRAADARGWPAHRLQEFTRNERLALGSMYARRLRAQLGTDEIARLVHDTTVVTPLAFRVRLEELRLTGGATRRPASAARLAAAGGVEDLMARLIEHWETELGAGPLGQVLGVLALARAGLARHEVTACAGGTEAEVAEVLAALDLHLLRLEGRIRFFHEAFRHSVEARYLRTDVERRALHRRLAQMFMGQDAGERGVVEAAWHLRSAGDREDLLVFLRRPAIVRTFVAADREHELVEHWLHVDDIDGMAASCVATAETACAPAVEAAAEVAEDHARDAIALALDMGAVLRRAGRIRDALRVLDRAAVLAAERHADDIRLNGAVAARLAPLLAAAGSLHEAEERYRSALTLLRAEHGDTHSTVVRLLGEYAGVLAAAGRRAEAEREYRIVLGMVERSGAGPMAVAPSVNNLATVMHEAGRYEEAEALYRRALDLWTFCGADAHPDAVAALNNLAALHFDRGEHAVARIERERVVELWERSLGPGHPTVAAALANLAAQITRDEPDAALPLLERALAIHDAAYPAPTHETAIILYTIGRAQYYAGRSERAEEFMRRAYDLQCQVLGADHVDTAVTLNGLAMVLRDRGENPAAELLLWQTLEILERRLGDRHPRVAGTLTNIAQLAARRGDRDTARELALRALDILDDAGSGSARHRENLRGLLAELDSAS